MPIEPRMHSDRARAESFGSAAREYDRFRPSYPAELIDDLAALRPTEVLDVGCGTGKASVLLAARGLSVLGVEVDERMAQVARGHGVDVEVSGFETWDAAGRTFDLITCGQAWHWIDAAAGIPKAADLLRPDGTLALFWNYGEFDAETQSALDAVYAREAPEVSRSVVTGRARRSDLPHVAELRASGRFAEVQMRTYHWDKSYPAAAWLALVQTHSDHLQIEPARRARLIAALAEAIDDLGGTVRSHYVTYAVFARVPG